MHATTDLRGLGASAINSLNLAKRYNEIIFISKKYSELDKIAEIILNEGNNQVRCLSL